MKLTLDHTQRLNLHSLLGAQRADVGSIRAIWAVQDKIALDAEEEKTLELKRELVGGQELLTWNPQRHLPSREFDFTLTQINWIQNAIEGWSQYGASVDRSWLEPIVVIVFNRADVVPKSSGRGAPLTDSED